MTTDATEKEVMVATGKEIAGTRTTEGRLTRLVPQSFAELEHIAKVLAGSDLVPKDLIGKPANVLLVLMAGNEIGLTPAQSLQSIMCVNGRTSLWGDVLMGLVLSSSVYEDSKDEFDEKTQTATFKAKRKGEDWVVRSFSMADAVKANLSKKPGPWQEYPKRMLFHRARSWALRDAFADVLKGLRYFEEERDVVTLTSTSEGGEKVYSMPKSKAETAVAPPVKDAVQEAEVIKDAAKAAAEKAKTPAPTSATCHIAKMVKTTIDVNGKDTQVIKIVGDEQALPFYTEIESVADMAKKIKEDGVEAMINFEPRNQYLWIIQIQRA